MKWRTQLDRELAPLGLTAAQYALLASLYALTRDGEPPSQRELAEFSGLETMYVSKLVRALQRVGLIERAPNPADARAVLLTVTSSGVEVVTEARAKVLELEARRLAPLGGRSSADSAKLRELLAELLRHAMTGGEDPPAEGL